MKSKWKKLGRDKQYQLSLWLKGVDLILMILVLLAFGVFTWYGQTGVGQNAENIAAYGGFIYVSEVLTLLMLLIFWRVATEIGRDNSFSMENVKHFRHIGYCAGLASLGYLIRMIYVIMSKQFTPFRVGYCIFLMIFGFLVLSICMILSCLIQNAYEMKQENDLTI